VLLGEVSGKIAGNPNEDGRPQPLIALPAAAVIEGNRHQ
jgi:hypothetical protein